MGIFRIIISLVVGAVESIVNAVHRNRQRRRLEKARKKLQQGKAEYIDLKKSDNVKNEQKEISK